MCVANQRCGYDWKSVYGGGGAIAYGGSMSGAVDVGLLVRQINKNFKFIFLLHRVAIGLDNVNIIHYAF